MITHDSRRAADHGVSLVELLVVMSLIAILLGLTAPMVASIMGGRGTTRAISEIISLVETARNEAMTRQCLVWLCFEQAIDNEGNDELRAVMMAPIDGTPSTMTRSGKVTISSAGAESLVYRWTGLKLVPLSTLPEIRALAAPDTVSDALAIQRAQPFFSSRTNTSVSYRSITFTPQGYAMLTALPKIATPYAKMIDLGLQPSLTGGRTRHPDSAALLLNGFNGQVQVLRP